MTFFDRIYKIKVTLPGTKFEPIYTNPFILLSNPTKQLRRAEVLDLAAKWGLNLQSPGFQNNNGSHKKRKSLKGKKRKRKKKRESRSLTNKQLIEAPKEPHVKVSPDTYSWTAVFNTDVKTLLSYEEFEAALATYFSEKFKTQIPHEILVIIEYFLSNNDHIFVFRLGLTNIPFLFFR